MGRVYLGNAFSLSMLNIIPRESILINVRRIEAKSWAYQILYHINNDRDDFECVIGHVSTKILAEKIIKHYTGEDIILDCERKQIVLNEDDILYVIQPLERLPPATELSKTDLELLLARGRVGFFAVEVV